MMITVLIPNVNGRALVKSNINQKVFITQSVGYYTDQEIKINPERLIEVPSLLYGIAMLYDDDFENAIKFIKENW